MGFDPNTRVRMMSFVKEVHAAPESTEMEAILFPGKMDRAQFTTLLKYLVSVSTGDKAVSDQLNVMFVHRNETYRLEVEGLDNISAYCNTNEAHPGHRLIKKWIVSEQPPIRERSFKVNLKRETEVAAQRDEVLQSHAAPNKFYRLKRRWSFWSDDMNFRYDLSIVRSSVPGARSMAASRVTEGSIGYEVEIEYVGNGKKASPEAITDSFLRNICELALASRGESATTVVSPSKRSAVLAYYKSVTNRDDFVGPMPVTLERANMAKDKFWDYHVLSGYTVTDKADGERRLLFVHSDDHMYMIDKEMNVTGTGAVASGFRGSLVDGEFVTVSRNRLPIRLFMVFDCYFDRGRPVAAEALKTRLKAADAVAGSSKSDDDFRIRVKTFYDDIYIGARSILGQDDDGVLPYTIDGLVFTPQTLPVGAMFKKKQVNLGGTWARVFKWKPPEDNSIDFLVKIEPTLVPMEAGGFGKVLELNVGYKGSYTQKITAEDYVANRFPNLQDYSNKPFKIPHLDLSTTTVPMDKSGQLHCLNGELITHDSVVEMVRRNGKWVPTRLRKDKTRGNDYNTALNIYRSIVDPVLKSDVLGETEVALPALGEDAGGDDTYYRRMYPREMSATITMLEFHNHWIKRRQLIERFRGKCSRVFDIACGRGGDLNKYIANDFKVVVGIDKSADNITNGKDGAYARLLQANNPKKRNMTIVFLPLDFSKPFPETDATFNFMMSGKGNAGVSRYKGVLNQRFDLVSCQFAVHYFMESKSVFRVFLANLVRVVENGGYFIGTCLDARALDAAFTAAKVAKGKSLSGRYDTRTIWHITKLYDRLGPKENWGKKVNVYMETIGQAIDEYLVDFDTMQKELEKVGLHPLSTEECHSLGIRSYTGMFGDVFEEMKVSENISAKNIVRDMTDDEKRYSFLNRWFIFKKA